MKPCILIIAITNDVLAALKFELESCALLASPIFATEGGSVSHLVKWPPSGVAFISKVINSRLGA